MSAEINNRQPRKSQRRFAFEKWAARKGKRKEAGHYSGLNENRRSKTLLTFARPTTELEYHTPALWLVPSCGYSDQKKFGQRFRNFATASVRVRT
jgi:hypothetical protein